MNRLCWVFVMPAMLAGALAYSGNWNVPTESKGLKNPIVREPKTLKEGHEVYMAHCVECHGPEAAGDGSKARVDYDLRTIVDPLTDGELYWKITHGVGKMPSFAGVLNDKERWLMVNYLRELRSRSQAPKSAPK